MRKTIILLAIAVSAAAIHAQEPTQGTLWAVSTKGKDLGTCPLKATEVTARISGFVARVNVRQEFVNTFDQPIEAIYTFPLSQTGAVDDMTMTIGARKIRGRIMKREEARAVYESARSAGKTAALLDQERPNIFTQAVANIMPGESVTVDISYVETLKYEDGAYEFVFPMTVGPRYVPGTVRDANKISPPVAESRPGHDISIEVELNAGVPVESIRSSSHRIEQVNFSPASAKVTLTEGKTIPNKDFILRYDVTGGRIEDAVLTHRAGAGGFFTLIIQPPDRIAPEDRTPKEIVFVLDTSGSMYGFPLEKAKEAMKLSLEGLYPDDTFNLITFAGDTRVLFEHPVPATRANLELAQAFLASREGGGGTEMMKAIRAALEPTDSQEHLRIVCFMTDGYVGNEDQIIAEIRRFPRARVFSFGIGSSVNRHLLDKMAEAGNGEVEYVSLTDDGSKAAKKFHERIRTPLLTDLSIDWNGLPVADVYPGKLTDLFSSKPVVLYGRYTGPATGSIRLKGKVAGQEYVREIAVSLPESQPANDALTTLWARRRVDELSSSALNSPAAGAINEQITRLGIDFRILTSFTSFVAVEEQAVNHSGTVTTVEVPVSVPEGVDRMMAAGAPRSGNAEKAKTSGAYKAWSNSDVGYLITSREVGETSEVVTVSSGDSRSKSGKLKNSAASVANLSLGPGVATGSGVGRGSGSGSGSGSGTGSGIGPAPAKMVSGGMMNGRAINLPSPEFPAAARAASISGYVSVVISVDDSGSVVSAEAVSGHPLLRASAVAAAKAAKFQPLMVSGKPVSVTGVIAYNFQDPEGGGVVSSPSWKLAAGPDGAPAAEDIRKWGLKEKLHTWVYQLLERLQSGTKVPGPNEAAFVRDGKAELQVFFHSDSPDTIEPLRAIGFEIGETKKKGKGVVGRIPLSKLAELAALDSVKLVLPSVR